MCRSRQSFTWNNQWTNALAVVRSLRHETKFRSSTFQNKREERLCSSLHDSIHLYNRIRILIYTNCFKSSNPLFLAFSINKRTRSS